MACRGVLFALSPKDEATLLDRAKPKVLRRAGWFRQARMSDPDPAVLEFVVDDLEKRWEQDWLCETDKAWDAIHRALSDGQLEYEMKQPRCGAILGGTPLYGKDDYIVSYKGAEQVAQIATALQAISNVEMANLYDAIPDDLYEVDKDDDDRNYTVGYFADVRDFFAKAAAAGRSVIFTVDQ